MKREAIFTERELDIMDILWERGNGTVGEVRDRLHDELAYTTVLTVLRTLEEKGYVGHETEGRAYRYYPLVERQQAQESHLDRLLRKLFSGSPELLVSRLVAHRGLSKPERERLRNMLAEQTD